MRRMLSGTATTGTAAPCSRAASATRSTSTGVTSGRAPSWMSTTSPSEASTPAATESCRRAPPTTREAPTSRTHGSCSHSSTRSARVTRTIRRTVAAAATARSVQASSGSPPTESVSLSAPAIRVLLPAASTMASAKASPEVILHIVRGPGREREIDRTLVIVGGRGDLVSRHTLPALAHLEARGLLPPTTALVAVDRESLTTAEYRAGAARLLGVHASAVPAPARQQLVERLGYRTADVLRVPDLADLLGDVACLVYLALPPEVVPAAVGVLCRSRLAPASRVVVEKPLGTDRASAAEIEALLRGVVDE